MAVRTIGLGDVAKSICELTYGDLMRLSEQLASMNSDKECRPKLETSTEFASLLHDWADAYEDD